ncbi:hypothetical protein PILCRDRAFT_135020 [Piloderma croceum F 1598]|uniref:Uncharacterized protein n=1 Tax=Piloderma croceum (strain F 1598) TaxID=765440 RepID=A0A0C3CPP6_PILCF|nr:hypothetical protein PILCRDRAFT_135020 [Piloderma croceum F 1598]
MVMDLQKRIMPIRKLRLLPTFVAAPCPMSHTNAAMQWVLWTMNRHNNRICPRLRTLCRTTLYIRLSCTSPWAASSTGVQQ